MSAMVSQIVSPTIVYSTVYSGADQRKHQSSASLAFVRGIPRWPVNSPHKGPVMRKMFLFDDVSCILYKWWNEIIHTFPNFSLGLNKLFHPHFTRHVIIYQCWYYSKSMSVPRGPPLYKDIVLSLTWEPHTWKDALYIETGPRRLYTFIVALWQHGDVSWTSLVQFMHYWLFGVKPLPKPMTIYLVYWDIFDIYSSIKNSIWTMCIFIQVLI